MPVPFILPPQHTQILIMGGGPAGSYAASVLAREGLDVTLLEAEQFPRYHIGESLLPAVRDYVRFIGAESILANHGFTLKPGSAIKFNQFKREGYTDFVALGCNNNSWNVIRSEFDHMLMNHARTSGASVHELTKVTEITFSPADPARPVSVTWLHSPPPPRSPPSAFSMQTVASCFGLEPSPIPLEPRPVTGTTTFTYLIDATGRSGILSTKYLNNRRFNASLKNIAVWGYWKHTSRYGADTPREGAPWFEALIDESGWAWFIPLHDGTTSVGIVMDQVCYNDRRKQPPSPSPLSTVKFSSPTNSNTTAHYLASIALAPGVVNLITPNATLEGNVKSASDFSYSASSYAGDHYRIVGDAGAFIDPFFSSGVHLALTSALSASATICATIRGHCTETVAANWHTKRVSTSYTRFQIVVLSAYKQIRAQNADILTDIDEDNYDRAFSLLRPVIQGASDMGKRLSESELQKSLDFCVNLFNPTSPEDHESISRSPDFTRELLDVTTPLMDPAMVEDVLQAKLRTVASKLDKRQSFSDAESVLETKMVLNKINARKVVHAEFTTNNMELEPIDGYVVVLERGRLGLLSARKSE